jgi:hypothetical protein
MSIRCGGWVAKNRHQSAVMYWYNVALRSRYTSRLVAGGSGAVDRTSRSFVLLAFSTPE